MPLSLLIWALVSPIVAIPLDAQTFKVDPKAAAPPQSLEDRRKALNRVFTDYWEDTLRHAPEFASSIGDKRFNDQISDYSVKAFNEALEREQGFLMRLAAIDNTGFTAQENISRDLLLRQFTEDQEASEFKEWEMPLNQMGGIHTTYPDLVVQLSFTTPKYLLQKVLDQVKELAHQKPEDSPLALPLKKFPASIPAADQERIKTEML